jgi:ABC-type thiamin/hydroxymethylpyrimidine transport system permease subunit
VRHILGVVVGLVASGLLAFFTWRANGSGEMSLGQASFLAGYFMRREQNPVSFRIMLIVRWTLSGAFFASALGYAAGWL